MNGAAQLLDIVGVYEQGVGQFQSGASEGAENQDALIIFARGHELLGN